MTKLKKIILFLWICFILIGSNLVTAKGNNLASYLFLPQVIDSKNVRLSNIIKELYVKKFLSHESSSTISVLNIDSNKVTFKNDFKHKEIKWLNWKLLADLGEGAYLIYKDIIFKNGVKKRLIYHTRWHSWRGKIYTGYLLDKEKKDLKDILELDYDEPNSANFFYPCNGLTYGTYWSWWINNVFKYRDNYYYISEVDNFDRNSGIRNIIKINSDGSLEGVATLKVYLSLNELLANKDFTIYKAYLSCLAKIMGQEPPNSGTMHSHTNAVMAGDYGATKAILRPWTLIDDQKERDFPVLKAFLKSWAYQDIWNLREYQTLPSHLNLTAQELKKFYIKSYNIAEKQAEIMGKNAVWEILNSYMVISTYFKRNYQKKNILNSINAQINKGSKVNWNKSKNKFNYESASLVIDNEKNIAEIHKYFSKEKLKTEYNKNLLMYAAHMNNYAAVKKLIALGYSVNEQTTKAQSWIMTPFIYNRTALMYAAENASLEIIRELVKAEAELTAVDSAGRGINYYLSKNPRFTKIEKQMGLKNLIKKYEDAYQIFRPSFNPQKAFTKIEKVIVNDQTLSIYDREMGKAYCELISLSNQAELEKKDQLNWLALRNKIANLTNSEYKFVIALRQLTRARTRYLYQRIQALTKP